MKSYNSKTSWTNTITGTYPDEQVFLRNSAGPAQIVVCVGLDGFDYNKYNQRIPRKWQESTRGKNIHMAMNAGAQFSFDQWEELNKAIDEAVLYLRGLLNVS